MGFYLQILSLPLISSSISVRSFAHTPLTLKCIQLFVCFLLFIAVVCCLADFAMIFLLMCSWAWIISHGEKSIRPMNAHEACTKPAMTFINLVF